MSAGRLLSVLLLLQTRGRLTARALAAELGVSVRTAYRDLARLQAAGFPVYGEPGRGGGHQLVDGYRTRLTGISETEGRAMLLAGLPGPAADLGLAEEVAAARLKLLAALPEAARAQAVRTASVFHLDAPGWYREADRTPYLPLLVDAVLTRHAVDVRYRRWREPREIRRRLCPLGLVLKSGTWYVVAAGPDRIATYRVSQILDATPSDERFDRPPAFDLATHWAAYLEEFRSRRHTGTATVRLSPKARERLPDILDPEITRAVEATATPPGPDGWTEAVIPTETTDHTCTQLLRLGPEVEVLGPPALREAMGRAARGLAEMYGVGR
ncbi:transcriptional regulator [Streptomyces albidoflavus]|uniref:helix-turn-helix transcriptional regulator n=1 Tax=Streptomyces albidoflavus TaxID=1886 RepID=UPI0033A61441